MAEDAARDGNLRVVQRLVRSLSLRGEQNSYLSFLTQLAHGARPDLKDTSQRSAIEYALPYPQIEWVCEEALRRLRQSEVRRFYSESHTFDDLGDH